MNKRGLLSVCVVIVLLILSTIFISAVVTDSDNVNVTGPNTAFGEVSVAGLTPLVQLQFPYGNNPRLLDTTIGVTGSSASATVANSLLTVATGTVTGSHVRVESVQHAKYHPGQGTLARWTAIFQASGVATAEAIAGIGNDGDGFFFGYDGPTFGILHRSDGRLEFQTLSITNGATSQSGTITVTMDGAATEVEVSSGDSAQAVVRAIAGTSFNEWNQDAVGTDVVFRSDLASDKTGSFSLVDTDSTGVIGTFAESVAGLSSTDDWIAQTDWNQDNLDGGSDGDNPSGMTLDVATGNVYEVQFQWLGFGEILFSVENPADGRFIIVHKIGYANTNTVPSLQNPTLPMMLSANNGGSQSNISVQSSSMAAFTEGAIDERNEGINNGAIGTAVGDLTAETPMLCVRNKRIFQNVENRVEWQPLIITFSANGAGAAKFTTLRAVLNPVIGGNPVFTDVATATSVIEVDTSAASISGGFAIATFEFGKAVEGFVLDLAAFTTKQEPGTVICFTVQISGGTSDADVALIWRELF